MNAVGEWLLSIAGAGGITLGALTVMVGRLRQNPTQTGGGVLTTGAGGLLYAFVADAPEAIRSVFAGTADPTDTVAAALTAGAAVMIATGTTGIARDFRRRPTPAALPAPRSQDHPARSAPSDRDRRRATEADHDAVREAYGAYVADVLAVLDRPALDDVTAPTTERFLKAMAAADDHRRGRDLTAYRAAVSELQIAWRAADEHARKTGVSHLPADERTAVTRARGLLELALDGRAEEAERQAAYAKARALLDGVLVIPRQALAPIERQMRPALSTTVTDVRKDPHGPEPRRAPGR
ncbi:DUF2786 domain-containing protein [Streptomyces sp. NPDC003691]